MKSQILFLACFLAQSSCTLVFAQTPETIPLPRPTTTGGKPLMQALRERKTIREIKSAALANQPLGDLLWAAFGINRPQIDHRTAPSAMNSQEIDLYVARQDGLFRYAPKPHALTLVSKEDLRARTSGQVFATNAPITLIYVADFSRLDKAKPDAKILYANFDAGCICQNVYLFCASEGLATVVHDLDRGPLARAMQLSPDQHIIMAQAVGWPLEPSSQAER
jgi:nitroreductase